MVKHVAECDKNRSDRGKTAAFVRRCKLSVVVSGLRQGSYGRHGKIAMPQVIKPAAGAGGIQIRAWGAAGISPGSEALAHPIRKKRGSE